MLIALEGLDRLGKSTLAEMISSAFSPRLNIIKVVTSKNPDGLVSLKKECQELGFNMPDFFEELVIIETLFQSRATNIILDRTIISADVYRLNHLPKSIYEFWLSKFNAMFGVYIWLDGEYEFYLKRVEEVGEIGTEREMNKALWGERRCEFTRYFINIKHRIGKRAIHIHNDAEGGLDDIATKVTQQILNLYFEGASIQGSRP